MIIHYHYSSHKQSICEEVCIALDTFFTMPLTVQVVKAKTD